MYLLNKLSNGQEHFLVLGDQVRLVFNFFPLIHSGAHASVRANIKLYEGWIWLGYNERHMLHGFNLRLRLCGSLRLLFFFAGGVDYAILRFPWLACLCVILTTFRYSY